LSQVTVEYQEHAGSVNTDPTTGSARAWYFYSFDPASGGANHSRMTAMIYPSGRTLKDSGQFTQMIAAQAIRHKMHSRDRFGRIIDQRWLKPPDVNNPTDRFKYGYDPNSNRLYRENRRN
jgi:hypothetical protein